MLKITTCIFALVFMSVQLQAAEKDVSPTMAVKAHRFFNDREWASAEALYGVILDADPHSDSVYVHAIVAASMLGHEERASQLLTNAMTAGLGFNRLMAGVRDLSFQISEPQVYEQFLFRSQRDCPWLQRPIDAELLAYYKFRNNGPLTVAYAKKMLEGLPDSTLYLADLAQGYAMEANFGQAVEVWKQILSFDPRNLDALLSIGNYYSIINRPDEAKPYLEQAYKINPTPYLEEKLR